MPIQPSDADWLAAAARLAARGRPLSRPNPAVGALLVRESLVVGRGWTQPGGRPHAEAMALDQAGEAAEGATLYVTLEPCAHSSKRGPACADLIIAAKPERVIVGVPDPDPRTAGEGMARIGQAGIEVKLLDSGAARASLSGYMTQRRDGRPHVTLKLAASSDGRIARPPGEDPHITGHAARAHVHAHRAMCDAILVGGETWRSDAPRLDVRLPGLEERSPRRLVLTRGDAPEGTTALPSPEAIHELNDIQYLYVEGGARTAAAFLDAGLVDRIELYTAPITIGHGDNAIAALGLSGTPQGWELVQRRQLGSDSYAAYERLQQGG